MKTALITTTLILITTACFSQISGQYYTKINKAKTVKIDARKGSKVDVHAETVIVYEREKPKDVPRANIIVNNNGDTNNKFYVVGYSQQRDSTGLYRTIIKFNNVGSHEIHDVDLGIKFDKSVESCDWNLGPIVFQMLWGLSDDKMEAFLKAGVVYVGKEETVTITSKERIFATISGTYGAYN